MTEETDSRSYRWVLPLIVGTLCGGLGGAVFTWYMSRPKPTVISYRVATTTLTAPEASGLIPGLKVLIQGTPIQALYAHIELLPRQGPFVDQAQVAFSFSSPVRIYGIHLESPSDLHRIECTGFAAKSKTLIPLPDVANEITSVQCTMRPVLFEGDQTRPFQVTIATDRSEVPQTLTAAKNLELVHADQLSQKVQLDTSAIYLALSTLTGLLHSPP